MPREISETGRDLARVLELLVDHPDRVDVAEFSGRRSVLFEVDVAPEDVGKIIGRQGRTIHSLRTLVEARGERDGQRYELEVLDG